MTSSFVSGQNHMKHKFLKIGLPLILLVLALGAYSAIRRRQADTGPTYITSAAARGPLKKVVNATGVVQTVLTVPVGSQVSGQVQELYADYNSVVKRGQLLAKLDTRNLDSQVANARGSVAAAQARVRSAQAEITNQAANLTSSRASLEAARVARDNAQVQLQRSTEMNQRGIVSKNDFDTAKANADSTVARYNQAAAAIEQVQAQIQSTQAQLEQANAGLQQAGTELDRAQINLEYANIFSPVDGVVISRAVDVGQTVAASMQTPTLFTIATDLGQMQVNANVDEADIGSISDNALVSFTVDAYPNDSFVGKIAEIRLSPQTVQNVVTYSVILSIENRDLKLKPGMTANISIVVDKRDNVLKVPNAAFRYLPPNTTPPPTEEAAPPLKGGARATAPSNGNNEETVFLPLAPGQKWNPNDKIHFKAPERVTPKSAVVWVLGADKKPQVRMVSAGITDGSATEILSGELKDGELVIVSDSTQASSSQQGFSLFGGNRGR
jgi:HlyD family secretion protein